MITEKVLKIEPYGYFITKEVKGRGQKNCQQCWFFGSDSHCPDKFKCVVDGKARIFIKINVKEIKK